MPATEHQHLNRSIEFAKAIAQSHREGAGKIEPAIEFFEGAETRAEQAEAGEALCRIFAECTTAGSRTIAKAARDLQHMDALRGLSSSEVAGEKR